MLNWIGDALEWIGSAWESTVGSALDTINEAVWDLMFKWLFQLIYGAIAELFEFINGTTSDVFSIAWVNSFVKLFHHMGWILFVCGLIIAVFDTAVAYESGQANVKGTCLNVLKGFFAASMITVIPQRLYAFCTDMQRNFTYDLLASFISDTSESIGDSGMRIISTLGASPSLFNLIFIILFGYCVIKVVLGNIKRGGILLCQIAVGCLYMFSVPRGYTDGFYGWCKQIIATCMTAFLQTTILYLGLLTFTMHPLISVGICLSSTEVPRIAQIFGLDTSVHVNMMAVSSTVSMGSKVARAVSTKS